MNVVGLGKTSLQSVELHRDMQSNANVSNGAKQKRSDKDSFSNVLAKKSDSKDKQQTYTAKNKSIHSSKKPIDNNENKAGSEESLVKKFPQDIRKNTGLPSSYSEVKNKSLTINDNSDNSFDSLSDKLEHLGYVQSEIADPLTRRASIQKFMAKMSDEFGIEPKNLVSAFGQLSTDELGMAPEETVAKVVENLNLSPMEKNQSKVYFKQMLQETESTSLAEYLKGSSRQLSLEVMSKNDAKKEQLNQSIDKLQSNFFNQNVGQEMVRKPQVVNPMIKGVESGMDLSGFEKVQEQAFVQSNTESLGKDALMPMQAQAKPMKSFDGMLAQLSMMKTTENEASPMESNLVAAKPNVAINSYLNQSSAFSQGENSQDLNSSSAQLQMSSDSELATDADSEFLGLMTSETSGKEQKVNLIPVNNKLVNVTAENEAENVQSIVKNAQTAIKNGGGEIKVNLNPEGLGELSLKVTVEEGKVNIDVLTENKSIKKMVESGLGDLKATLQAHKLDVEQIKVDVNNDLMEDFNDQQKDADQQFARKFMQDFSRQNQQFRQGLGFGPVSKPGSQMDSKQDEIDELVQKNKKSSNRALDLVA